MVSHLAAAIYEKLGFRATPAQAAVFVSKARIKLISGGERAGKSITDEKEALPKIVQGGLFWLVGDYYEAVRGEWNYLVDDLIKCFGNIVEVSKVIDPGHITIAGKEGIRIETKSAQDPKKLATEAPDGILVCEAAQVDYEVYLRLRGRLAEKRGWMNLAGTLEGSIGWFPEMYTRWSGPNTEEAQSFSLPTWSNIAIFPGGENDPEIVKLRNETPADRFAERYGGVPVPVTGRVVTEFCNQIHVGTYEFDSDLPVEIAVDPGYAGAHAVLACQQWGEQLVVIDEIYLQGVVTKDIITICRKTPWWTSVTGGAIDIAAKQHQAMEAPIEIWLHDGHLSLRTLKVGIEDGIDLLQTHLKVHPISNKPGILINSKCKGLIAECGGGKSPVETGGMWMRDKNTHVAIDKNNHATKALIYLLANKFGFTDKATRVRRMFLRADPIRETKG